MLRAAAYDVLMAGGGKVGKGSHTYLMSPMAAMATAVRGCITDPRDILK